MFFKRYRREIKGFTLIELLVVIMIIAILAAILFPVFMKVRDKGRQATCVSNMKQMSTAVMMYLEDTKGLCPPCGNIWTWDWPDYYPNPTVNYPCLFDLLLPYVKNDNVFKCKTLPHRECICYRGVMTSGRDTETWVYNSGKWYGTTYTTHFGMAPIGYQINKGGHVRTNAFAQLAFHPANQRITNLYSFNYRVLDGAGEKAGPSNSNIIFCMSGGWFTSIDRFAYTGYHVPGKHLDSAILLFADGHVQVTDWRMFGV